MFEVEGLPEGWKAVGYRIASNENVIDCGEVIFVTGTTKFPCLIVEKIQPRRIVLEEISKEEYHRLFNDERCPDIYNIRCSYWREVNETDFPLTKEEPELSLSVNECKEAMRKLETFNVTDLSVKICRFLKENQ